MHRPVLYHEIIHALRPRQGGLYVDCTIGAGGHAEGILRASNPDGRLLGLDLDPDAIALAQERLAEYLPRFHLVRASYITLSEQLARLGWVSVDGIVIDLGVSSMQLDNPEKGFSFQMDANLDMRFDPENPVDASKLVNKLSESELADIIYHYSDERYARQIAKAIVAARPIFTTHHLAEVVARVVGRRKKGIHPATRTFQALRIAVNQEMENLKEVLPLAISALTPGGRLAVIAFHSIEDRLVKKFFREESKDCICPPRQPVCTCGHRAIISEVTRQPIKPMAEEIMQNPRSRSAKLRVAEKLKLE